jgi:hypothetical protein
VTQPDTHSSSTDRYRFELSFYRRSDKAFVSAAEYLDSYRRGDVDWTPDVEYIGLSLVVDGQEWTLRRRGMGRYPKLIPQLAAVSSRVSDGRAALLRTAVEDVDIGTYFLFEPRSDHIFISLFYITDTDFFCCYPIPDASIGANELYEYVRTNRAFLLSAEAGDGYRFNELPFPREQLIAALAREVEVGRSILSLPEFRDS